ncbi:uncharacterized protein LOC116601196 isoform X2 [Nematostella vectensis]|uniref:uncharacterized protein LOC116601196 isoform X2 n=1 Tax=Nematostella vectensis TaxID=45351 RepID=UPI002077925D|nr:uncharacterized protein LOC116601196 isoform X2 [Nematostella vectensis]
MAECLQMLLLAVKELCPADLKRKLPLPTDFFKKLTSAPEPPLAPPPRCKSAPPTRRKQDSEQSQKNVTWMTTTNQIKAPETGTYVAWEDFLSGRIVMQSTTASPDFLMTTSARSSREKARASFMVAVKNLSLNRRRAAITSFAPKEGPRSDLQPIETHTIWQQVAMEEKKKRAAIDTKQTGSEHKSKKKCISLHCDHVSAAVGECFHRVRAQSARRARDKLSWMESNQHKIFDGKFRALKPSQSFHSSVSKVQKVGQKLYGKYERSIVTVAEWLKSALSCSLPLSRISAPFRCKKPYSSWCLKY